MLPLSEEGGAIDHVLGAANHRELIPDDAPITHALRGTPKCPRRDRICVPRRLAMLPGYDPLDEVGANVNLAMRRSGRTRLAAGAESMTEIPRCRTVRF